MMGRKVMGALLAGAMGATPVFADVFAANIVEQLQTEGFKTISMERTWLGRTRIVAEGELGQREIIVNPNNGEILRDLLVRLNPDDGSALARQGSGAAASVASSASKVGTTDDWGDSAASLRDKTWTDKEWADNDWGDRNESGGDKGGFGGGSGGGSGGEDNGGGSGGMDN